MINALSERLKQGTLADMVVVDSLPAPADVVLDPAPEAAAAAAEPAAAEPAAVVETVDLREQGAASAEAVLSGEVDPFVFDAADLPDSTGNFAWEAEEPPTGGPATTF